MKIACLFLLVTVISASADEFEKWKGKHNKTYHSAAEENKRRGIFSKNLDFINKHNANGNQSYTLAMNHLGDLTAEEFNTIYNGYKQPVNQTRSEAYEYRLGDSEDRQLASIDWRSYNYVTSVKNQGNCGSCWTFSAVGAIESQWAIKRGRLNSLSEQNALDCVTYSYGCNGGWPIEVFKYVINNRGIDYSYYYPYQGVKSSCRYNYYYSGASIYSYGTVPPYEDYLKSAVANIGPISVAIDASYLQFYYSGIFYSSSCSSSNLNHAVLAVGYGTSNGQDYWIIKNSWGNTWGMSGYLYLARNRGNMCGVASQASYPIV